MERFPWLMKALKLERKAQQVEEGARAVEATSALARESKAAFEAADNIASFTFSAKHSPGAAGTYSKFASGVNPYKAVAEALRSERAVFKTNPGGMADRFRVITNLGRVVGSKGQTSIRVVVSNSGRIITAFPVK